MLVERRKLVVGRGQEQEQEQGWGWVAVAHTLPKRWQNC